MKSEQEHRYTSTGIKFWQHRAQMEAYREGQPGTVISTHIAPEGACNLSCPYCSVTHRDVHSRISLDVIKDYVTKLMSRGLKAVILTGGGEPTVYPQFNELVRWLHLQGLRVALITNGTLTKKVERGTWGLFDWIRVSINFFKGWEERISLPLSEIGTRTTVGCSMVFTQMHEQPSDNWLERFEKASMVADRCGAHYIRVLPNCLLPEDQLSAQHEKLDLLMKQVNDPRYFRQDKHHRAPNCGTCHQSYFRPYLSEECFGDSDQPGSVYPCDSVVLNDAVAKFAPKWQLCAPADILDYIDGKIPQRFDPRDACTGCVFTETVEMLGHWKASGVGEFPDLRIEHEEFV